MKSIKYSISFLTILLLFYIQDVFALNNGMYLLNGGCLGFGVKTNEIMETILTIIFWGVPTLAIIYTMMDIFKAVTSGDVKDVSATFKKFGLRGIIIVLTLLTPSLLKFLFEIFGLKFCFF
ncbi:MAG: hypothetical protein GX864_01265 [Mollicutes bacterium]|nr:hypothetical protein [Mollicutes bacterium]